jgi:cobalt/nickel transport system permease protein
MSAIESALLNIGTLDDFARRSTPITKLDPRTKLITTIAFIITVVSFSKYQIAQLLPLTIYPIALLTAGNIPFAPIAKRLLLALPFVLLVAIFNPLLDREPILTLGPITITAGWISFASILLRFTLTLGSALLLIATTGFNPVCLALEKLRVPQAFVIQLLFLYRYIFVLINQAARLMRAHSLRSFSSRHIKPRVFASMLGHLLIRTLDRAQHIHTAMYCRGFDGRLHIAATLKFRTADAAYLFTWLAFFILVRLINLPQAMGQLFTGSQPMP